MGLEHLKEIADDRSRAAGVAGIMDEMQQRFLQENTAYWMERFVEADIIGAPVQTYHDIVKDPQARTNGYVIDLEHPHYGTTAVAGSPLMFGRKPTVPQGRPPELGEHTEQYLLELGYDWEQIGDLRAREVI